MTLTRTIELTKLTKNELLALRDDLYDDICVVSALLMKREAEEKHGQNEN